jgi:hypothetical protein
LPGLSKVKKRYPTKITCQVNVKEAARYLKDEVGEY